MTSALRAGRPPRWPFLDLDVAVIRAAGHRPVPFQQFILKVHSRCNLACSYCYVYEMADQGWRGLPRRMNQPVADKTVERIAEHAERHHLTSVDVILHGGEPLLAGAEWLAGLVGSLRARVPAEVNVALQTNGTLLDRPMLAALRGMGVRVGVSLDGDAEATGRHRRYANGRNSFDAVAAGLDLLRSPEFADCYSGILCTVDTCSDPVRTYEALLAYAPPALDLLLPHANWSCAPPGAGYADWLISVFERWYTAPRQETRIRLFSELIQLVLGQPGAVEGLGLLPSTLLVVDTDGSVKELDSLSSAYPGAADTGLHVMSNSFDDALDHPTTVARQIGADALAPQCLDCPVMEICGGGLYPHRFRDGDGFRNPSVYCADLLTLITHVRDRVVADLSVVTGAAVGGLQVIRFHLRGQPGSLRRGPRLGMLHGERALVPVQYLGEAPPAGGLVSGGHFVAGKVGRCHQRIGVIVAEDVPAIAQCFPADPDGLAELAAQGQVGGEIDVRRQGERMAGPVNPDEAVPGLIVRGQCPFLASRHAQHRRQVDQRGVEEDVRRADLPAQVVGLPGQFLGAREITDGAPVIDQPGGGSHRVHVVHAQVVAAPLQHVLAFLQRVPVMAGLAQRGGESLARVQPRDVLPAADRVERADDPAGYVKGFLVETETALVAGHRVPGLQRFQVVGAQDAAAVLECALVGLQGLTEQPELPVVDGDVAPDVQRALVIDAEDTLELRPDAHVQVERVAELAVRAQVRAVDALAEQQRPEALTVGIALKQRTDVQDQLV